MTYVQVQKHMVRKCVCVLYEPLMWMKSDGTGASESSSRKERTQICVTRKTASHFLSFNRFSSHFHGFSSIPTQCYCTYMYYSGVWYRYAWIFLTLFLYRCAFSISLAVKFTVRWPILIELHIKNVRIYSPFSSSYFRRPIASTIRNSTFAMFLFLDKSSYFDWKETQACLIVDSHNRILIFSF